MKAIDLIFRETLTPGQFEMKNHVLVFIDEAGNEYSDTFSEVRHNGRFEAYQYHGIPIPRHGIPAHAEPYGSYFLK